MTSEKKSVIGLNGPENCGKFLKLIYFGKATQFCEIFILLFTTVPTVHTVKSKVKISHNFVAFSEYINFNSFFNRVILRISESCNSQDFRTKTFKRQFKKNRLLNTYN